MKKVNLSLYTNSWFQPASKTKIVTWYFFNIVFLNNRFLVSSKLKSKVLRLFGAKIGDQVVFKQSINIKYPWHLIVEDNAWIGENVWIDNLGVVKIGRNVCISQGAYLLTGNHNYKKESFDLIIDGIVLEDGVWIGAKSVVCPGVTCHSHSILTVGSIATKNLESYSIYSGNPATYKTKREII